MRTLNEFQKINENNLKFSYKNIRKKAGKCGEYFTDKEIDFIIVSAISMSRKILTITYLVYYMRYQILYTDWVKDVYSNGYLEYENLKYGNIIEFQNYIKDSDIKDILYSKSSNATIEKFDNRKYELVNEIITIDGEVECDEYWRVVE